MKIKFVSDFCEITFDGEEMGYLVRLSRAVGIPLENFGGLSSSSPFVRVRLSALAKFAEENFDVESISSRFGFNDKIDKLEAMPVWVRKQIRTSVIHTLTTKLPKGFFVKK